MVGDTIGGTSGAVYGLLLTTAAGYIRAHPATFDLSAAEVSFGQRTAAWLALLRHTIDRISVYSGARRGDRSMLGKFLLEVIFKGFFLVRIFWSVFCLS